MTRVAVVGARRVRQGIGHHLARFCAASGADVCAVLGRSPESARAARDALVPHGPRPRAYTDAQLMVEREDLDVLVIASPHESHEAFLELALAADLHVLCEKPLLWGGESAAETSRRLVARFLERDLHLVLNTQWPYTLDTYRQVHPGILATPPRTFAMRLSPGSSGPRMLPDALPHPLSLLAAALPDASARVADIRIRRLGRDARGLDVRFLYQAAGQEVRARVQLRQVSTQPRAAGYAFDGRRGRRRVSLPEYDLFLGDGGSREVPLPDPTPRLVEAFLSGVSCGDRPQPDAGAWPGMAHLLAFANAYPS